MIWACSALQDPFNETGTQFHFKCQFTGIQLLLVPRDPSHNGLPRDYVLDRMLGSSCPEQR